ncbi:MAG: phosphate ABC transporter substrate-binding protein PstS [Propioniciclava sp.]|uniref:phosphate ABC transporter substrate-binding protein PstS n=1 Tax=Propioniciclava sp. TaxID=2038686 RepID=UPI0039E677AB
MFGPTDDGVPVLRTPEARRRNLVVPLIVAVVLAGVALAIALTGRPQSALTGSGSTLAQPLIERAAADFRAAASADDPGRPSGGDPAVDGGGIDYEAVGSLGGLMRLRAGAVDFAVSDYPLSERTLAEDGLAQFPLAVGAVALVHTLDLPAGAQLRLDGDTVAAIYLGEIARWDDARIRALNPGLDLPGQPIVPVHRTDGSGSTFGFTGWLSATSQAWASGPGAGALVGWPDAVGRGAERSGGVLAELRAHPGALGYVDHGQAARAGLAPVAVGNASGAFVTATPAAMTAAVAGADWSGDGGYAEPIIAADAPEAYPMTVAIYALLRAENTSRAHQVLSFLGSLLSEADASARDLGYLPLPEDAARAVTATWQTTFGYPAAS